MRRHGSPGRLPSKGQRWSWESVYWIQGAPQCTLGRRQCWFLKSKSITPLAAAVTVVIFCRTPSHKVHWEENNNDKNTADSVCKPADLNPCIIYSTPPGSHLSWGETAINSGLRTLIYFLFILSMHIYGLQRAASTPAWRHRQPRV